MKKTLTLALVFCAAAHAFGVEIENASLRVTIEETGSLKVTDKRSGAEWKQRALSPEYKASAKPRVAAGKIEFPILLEGRARKGAAIQPAEYKAVAWLESDKPELILSLEPSAEVQAKEWHGVKYPFVFMPPRGPESRILYPHGEGMLVPVDRKDPGFIALPEGELYGGVLSYLNCIGAVDLATGSGFLAIPQPFESAQVFWPQLEGEPMAFEHGMLASRYKMDRPMVLRWHFVDKGGYVAMAKAYRGWCGQNGWRRTLRDKAKANPEVDKLAGAPIFWAYGNVKELDEIYETLRAGGMKRCVLGLDQRLYYGMLEPDPAELAERQALVKKVRDSGFLVHHYDNFRDAFQRDPNEFPWFQLNMDAYPHDIMVREDGRLLCPGFKGHTGESVGGVITPGAFVKYARIRLPKELERYPWNARFIDCIGSCAFKLEGEDYHPERLQTSMYSCREQREALSKYSFELGQVTGTECGLDYLIPYTCWFDGAMSLVRYVNLPPGTFALQNANADGSMAGTESVDEKPLGGGKPYAISESIKYRIPFWSLVHHDDAVVTWRWENGMNQPMEHWRRKLLLNLLHGTPPMYRMDAFEFRPIAKSIAETNSVLAPWLQKVAFDEMLGHRFLTPDRTVQMTWFGSENGIVVNFGSKPYRAKEGVEIPAEGFAFFEGTPGPDGLPKQFLPTQILPASIGLAEKPSGK